MAKQTLKQQMIQQIANSQVQQVMQERQAAQLQANFAAWQKEQDDIAQLQASFAAWQKENAQPVQQPVQEIAPVKAQQTIPSLGSYKDEAKDRALARRQRLSQLTKSNKENQKQREDYQRQQQEEAILASRDAMKGEKKWNESVDNTLAMLNSNEFKDMAKKGKAQKALEDREQKKKAENEAIERQIAGLDTYNTNNLPQLTDNQKALEEQILNADRYVNNAPKERWNERFLTAQEKSDAINNTTPEDVARWLSPDTKLTQKEKGMARAYAAAELAKIPTNGSTHQPMVQTDEERQHYADMVEIMNKTNPISSAMSGYMELPFNLVDMVGDAGRSVGNQISGLGAAVTDKLGITEGATQRHNERVEASNELASTNEENMRRSMANAQTQYPLANAGGKLAGQITMYAVTNPVFDGIAEGAGVTSELAKFFINQGAQNAQDLALDTAPLVKQLMSDGSMSEEDKREVFNNVVLNALGNAGIGVAQEIPNIAKYVGGKVDARNAANAKFAQYIKDGQEKLHRANMVIDAANAGYRRFGNFQEVDISNFVNDDGKLTQKLIEHPEIVTSSASLRKPIEQIEAESSNLMEEIYRFRNKKMGKNEVFHIGEPSEILKEFGFGDKPLYMTQDDMRKALAIPGTEKVKHPHYVGTGAFEAISEKLDDPIAIIKNKSKDKVDSFVILTDIANLEGDPGLIALKVYNNGKIVVEDKMTSLYGKSKIKDYLYRQIGERNVLYFKQTKSAPDEALRSLQSAPGSSNAPNVGSVDQAVPSNSKITDAISEVNKNSVNTSGIIDVDVSGARPYATNQDVSPSIENAVEGIENAAKTQQIETPKTNTVDIPEEAQEQIFSDFEEIYRSLDNMDRAANATENAKVIEKFNKLQKSVFDYEDKVWNAETLEEVNKAKKAADAARQSFIREMKKIDPKYTGDLTGTKLGQAIYRRGNPKLSDADTQAMINDWVQTDASNPNRFVRDAQPDSTNVYRGVNNVPGAEPLQTFADGTPKNDWKISKARTKTFENQGWGDNLPEKDFAYRVQRTADTHEIKAERYRNSENVAADLLNKDYDTFDAADVKASMETIQELMDNGDFGTAKRLAERLAHEGREGGRTIQAFAEYNKNSISGALRDASNAQEDFVLEPWRSKNKKAREGNSRIAKALADMGHKPDAKIRPELTHDQIKNGVIAELNREVGSVEQYFNDNDIEFLTRLAEDKSVPTWQITSEIEHKLNTGDWYTIDESVDIPKPTNRRLQNALNSLVTETVRAESEAPSLKQIAEEVRNTLGKESADFEELFTDDDMDYLANLIHEGATKDELADALDMKLATGSFGISDETLQEVNNIFKQISNYDPNSKQFVEGQAEAYRLLANEILPNATLKEKFEAWRYIAMLGNPKTMLRNYIGNQTFNVVTGISNNVAALAEAGVDRASKALGGEGIQRTKAVLNPKTDSGLIKACAEDADASRYRQIIGSKYEKMSKDTLRRSKSVFNSKLAQLYEKVTDAGISDYSAVKKKYSTSLAGYMKANGMSTDIFKAEEELRNLRNLSETRLLSDAEKARVATLSNQVQELEKARDYALKQAEYATFHEDNKIADVLSKWSRTSKEEGTGIGHLLIEGVVPFKKTPANVLKSGYHYSPLGAIDSIKKTGKLIYENTGVRKGNLADVYKNKAGKDVARTLASDVIDSWSKTLTGTGLTALGIYLYNKGILHSSDPDTKYQDELEGHQNYAIEINGKSYTIDWAAPTIMPLMIGAEIAKVWDSTGKGDEDLYNNLDDYIALANRLADPLVETSMLSGVKDTLDTAASAAQNNENLNIPAMLLYNTLTGYASQGVPTIAGQIARTIDPTRRSTYTDKEGVSGILDKQLKKQMNKIPGVSMLNQPYINTYGEEQQNSPFENPFARLGYQMFSPGYLTNINETDADAMSREAYAVSKNANTLPKWQSKFKDAEGNRVSPEDYTTASKAYGVANREIRDALANDEWFNSLEGTQKEEIAKGINTIAEHVGNAAIDPNYTKDSKAYNAYKDGGISGLLDYYKGETAKDTAKDLLGDSGVTTNSNAGKAITEAVKNGDMAQVEKLAEQAKEEKAEKVKVEETKSDLSSYGLTSISPAKTYEKAQDIIPGLTMEKFATTYKKIDADGNQGIKQDEVISYLNSQKITSESEAKKIWSAYGNSTWKSIPKLENGKWVKKKK